MFSIVLIMLILQMLAGIIIDNFSALREHQQMINEDKDYICFICDLHKNELNKLYGNEEGYQEHIKIDHYYWNYMFYLMNLIEKSPNELSGIDAYIFENYKNQNHQWIAFKT
jgi:inositol 1,4,5-triphosphate receptor type 1